MLAPEAHRCKVGFSVQGYAWTSFCFPESIAQHGDRLHRKLMINVLQEGSGQSLLITSDLLGGSVAGCTCLSLHRDNPPWWASIIILITAHGRRLMRKQRSVPISAAGMAQGWVTKCAPCSASLLLLHWFAHASTRWYPSTWTPVVVAVFRQETSEQEQEAPATQLTRKLSVKLRSIVSFRKFLVPAQFELRSLIASSVGFEVWFRSHSLELAWSSGRRGAWQWKNHES